jgi:nucleotide-binding universal stress UspA family protein
MVKPIVVVADGSELSRLALTRAGDLARRTGQGVVVVFVRHSPLSGATKVFASEAVLTLEIALDAAQTLALAQSISEFDPSGIAWSFEVRSGQPMEQILDTAMSHHADTIVIAARYHRWLGKRPRLTRSGRLARNWPGTLVVIHGDQSHDPA